MFETLDFFDFHDTIFKNVTSWSLEPNEIERFLGPIVEIKETREKFKYNDGVVKIHELYDDFKTIKVHVNGLVVESFIIVKTNLIEEEDYYPALSKLIIFKQEEFTLYVLVEKSDDVLMFLSIENKIFKVTSVHRKINDKGLLFILETPIQVESNIESYLLFYDFEKRKFLVPTDGKRIEIETQDKIVIWAEIRFHQDEEEVYENIRKLFLSVGSKPIIVFNDVEKRLKVNLRDELSKTVKRMRIRYKEVELELTQTLMSFETSNTRFVLHFVPSYEEKTVEVEYNLDTESFIEVEVDVTTKIEKAVFNNGFFVIGFSGRSPSFRFTSDKNTNVVTLVTEEGTHFTFWASNIVSVCRDKQFNQCNIFLDKTESKLERVVGSDIFIF